MASTVVGLFDTFAQAQQAVQDLTNSGVRREDISIIANDAKGEHVRLTDEGTSVGEGAATGAVSGGVLGGVLGLLIGIGALAIPGIGPVLAAGPLAAALGSAGAGTLLGAGIGAVSGGLLGALVGAGVPEEEAHLYAEGVRRGGTLVTVTTDDASNAAIRTALQNNGAVDINTRGGEWRQAGWERFDPNAAPVDDVKHTWDDSSKVGTATGTAVGAVTGAAAGSVAGPVGTIVGGIAGAAAGAGLGAAGDVAGEKVENAVQGEVDDHAPRRRVRIY